MLILLTILSITSARLLQGGNHPRDHGNHRQQNNTIEKIFEDLSMNLDQDKKEELKMIQKYLFDEGFKYYLKQDNERKEKIWNSLFGIPEELDKQKGKENKRIEKDIEYFSQLNNTDKDIVLTKTSQALERNLNDTTKTFNSKLVLTIIEQELENFQTNPDRSTKPTWNTNQYINQSQEKKELKEIEYQIQVLLDQGLSDQDVKNNITVFINQYFNDSQTLQNEIQNLDKIIQEISHEEQQKNSTQKYKQMRQQIRQTIRDSLKEGKNEEEIQQIIQDLLNQNEFKDLDENQKEEIKQIISNELIRYNRQKNTQIDSTENHDQQLTNKPVDDDNDGTLNTTKNTEKDQNNSFLYLGLPCAIVVVLLILFVIRRQRMKKNKNSSIGFKMQESQQEVEQME